MYVVNLVNTFNGKHRARDFFHTHFEWTSFQQNVGRFAQNSDAGPEDEKADGETENGVEPLRAGDSNGDGAGDDRDVGKSVAEIVDKNAAQIEIVAAAYERQRNSTI